MEFLLYLNINIFKYIYFKKMDIGVGSFLLINSITSKQTQKYLLNNFDIKSVINKNIIYLIH